MVILLYIYACCFPLVLMLGLLMICCVDGLLDSGASFNVDFPRNNFKTSTNWSSRIVQGFNSCNLGTVYKVIIIFSLPDFWWVATTCLLAHLSLLTFQPRLANWDIWSYQTCANKCCPNTPRYPGDAYHYATGVVNFPFTSTKSFKSWSSQISWMVFNCKELKLAVMI